MTWLLNASFVEESIVNIDIERNYLHSLSIYSKWSIWLFPKSPCYQSSKLVFPIHLTKLLAMSIIWRDFYLHLFLLRVKVHNRMYCPKFYPLVSIFHPLYFWVSLGWDCSRTFTAWVSILIEPSLNKAEYFILSHLVMDVCWWKDKWETGVIPRECEASVCLKRKISICSKILGAFLKIIIIL